MSLNESGIKVLIVEDDRDILELLTYNLRDEGYQVLRTTHGERGIEIAKKELPDLIILDVMLPGIDGVEVCHILRNEPSLKDSIIVFLSARGEEYSQIAGLEAGADDYLVKPIATRLLKTKVRSLLKRTNTDETIKKVVTYRDLHIDKEKYELTKGGEIIDLPKKEFEILCMLVKKPEKVFSREEIYEKIWGHEIIVGARTLDVHISNLRKKVGKEYFKTIKGIGYKVI